MQMLVPPSRRKKMITPKEIEAVIATMARIPPKIGQRRRQEGARASRSRPEARRVRPGPGDREARLGDQAAAAPGLRDPDKPIGNYLFSGPTGVGKTEVARQLASIMGIPLQRFDMSEYMERHSVSRLIGAPPGYVGYDQGGLLTDAVDQHPHCVLLLDEIEKAHPDLFNILLQVMDNGKLTDHHGKTVDFRNVILIMTTNAGASDMARESIGFGAISREDAQEEAVKKMFTPEFRNRLDAIVPFGYLPPAVVARVVDKFILQLELQLADRNVHIELDDEAREWLTDARLRQALRRAADGPAGPGEDQAAARRGTAVRQAGQRRRGQGPDQGQCAIAIVPMPLVPPWTSTQSPSAAKPRSNRFTHTVNNVSGMAAASTSEMRSGTSRQVPDGRDAIFGIAAAGDQRADLLP